MRCLQIYVHLDVFPCITSRGFLTYLTDLLRVSRGYAHWSEHNDKTPRDTQVMYLRAFYFQNCLIQLLITLRPYLPLAFKRRLYHLHTPHGKPEQEKLNFKWKFCEHVFVLMKQFCNKKTSLGCSNAYNCRHLIEHSDSGAHSTYTWITASRCI